MERKNLKDIEKLVNTQIERTSVIMTANAL